mmetsp:Transcript_20081/g.42866  ORF Transcript_20081/g.42866 Transcript_20081/m.42866 type:complete len:219 (-) Transcript_20081:17-673(-)
MRSWHNFWLPLTYSTSWLPTPNCGARSSMTLKSHMASFRDSKPNEPKRPRSWAGTSAASNSTRSSRASASSAEPRAAWSMAPRAARRFARSASSARRGLAAVGEASTVETASPEAARASEIAAQLRGGDLGVLHRSSRSSSSPQLLVSATRQPWGRCQGSMQGGAAEQAMPRVRGIPANSSLTATPVRHRAEVRKRMRAGRTPSITRPRPGRSCNMLL